MTHDEFLAKLDGAILSGASAAQVARGLGLNQTTVRRRKAALRAAGHNFTLRDQREADHATYTR
jgi:transposase-like protein